VLTSILQPEDILTALEDFNMNAQAPELMGLNLPGGWTRVNERMLTQNIKGRCGDNSSLLQVFSAAGTPVALKIYASPAAKLDQPYDLLSEIFRSGSSIKQYLIEAHLVPKAIRVPSHDTTVPALLMDWITDLPLHQFVERHRPGKNQSGRVLVQLANALRRMFQAFHKERLVHGDCCNKNIVVRQSNGAICPRFLDCDTLSLWTAPCLMLLKTRGQGGFVHPARRRDSHVIEADPQHTDAFSEFVLYLSVLCYTLIVEMSPARADCFGLAPYINQGTYLRIFDQLRRHSIPKGSFERSAPRIQSTTRA
jgi:hypothetical protein